MSGQPFAPSWLSPRRRWLLALAGALTMPWAFPSTSLGWLSIGSVAALVVAVYRTGPRAAAGLGTAFGFLWAIISLRWADVISPVAWIGLSAIVAVWTALFGVGATFASRRRSWPWVVPWLWVAVEQLRCLIPWGGFPWLRLGFVGGIDPLLPAAWLVSSAGVSWILAAAATAVAYVVINGARSRSLLPALIVAFGASGLVVSSLTIQARAEKRVVALGYVQPSQTPREISDPSQRGELLNDTIRGAADAAQQIRSIREREGRVPAVVALAEDALPGAVWQPGRDNQRLSAAVDAADASFLAGFVVWTADGRNLLNRSALWQPGVGAGESMAERQWYDKRHLVPFGEWVPFRNITESWVSEIALVSVDFASGKKPGRFMTADDVSIGTVICFETAYDDVTRDVMHSDVLTVQTNNSAFLGTEQPTQQFTISKARAAEAGRPLVVAAATGVSGIVDSRGRVVPGTLTSANERRASIVGVNAGGFAAPAFTAGPLIRWGSVAITAMLALFWCRALVASRRLRGDGGDTD